MNSSVVCIVLLLTIFSTSAYTAIFRGDYKDPKNPGKCTIKENLILAPNEIIKDPEAPCARIICGEDGFAEFHSCGAYDVDGCKVGDYKDKSLPYPDCCERHVICDQKDKI